jgi:prevent-host-death family protein
MKTIKAAEFKARCLSLLDELEPEGLVVTKRGRPVARVLPFRQQTGELIGALRGTIAFHGTILSTGADWTAAPRRRR